MDDKIKKQLKLVQSNVYTKNLQNQREIDIQNGDMIVLGYYEITKEGRNSYVVMGVYDDGELNYSVNLTNTLILEITTPYSTKCNALDKQDEDYIDCASWWRIPTDNEMELYNMLYPKNSLIKYIEKIISEIESNELNLDEIIDSLTYIKEEIEEL